MSQLVYPRSCTTGHSVAYCRQDAIAGARGVSAFLFLAWIILAHAIEAVESAEIPAADHAPTGINLVKNAGFESGTDADPLDWHPVGEDTTVPWRQRSFADPDVGVFNPAVREYGNARTGAYSIRCAAAEGQLSGVTQRVHLNQDAPAAIEIGAWCKAENVMASSWCDLALTNIRYADGTYHDTNWEQPFLPLAETTHGWAYRSRIFEPEKPVRYVDLRISIQGHMGEINNSMPIGSERTGLLWVDAVHVGEIETTAEALQRRGIEAPVQTFSAFPLEGEFTPAALWPPGEIHARFRSDTLEFTVTGDTVTRSPLELYLVPCDSPAFDNWSVASFFRVTVPRNGPPELARAFERVERGFAPRDAVFYLDDPGADQVTCIRDPGGLPGLRVTIPATAMGAVPEAGAVWRFNVVLDTPEGPVQFAPGPLDHVHFARLALAAPPPVTLSPVQFGDRPGVDYGENDWITRTDTWWGDNTLVFQLTNNTTVDHTYTVRLGGTVIQSEAEQATVPAGGTVSSSVAYRTETPGLGEMEVVVEDNTGVALASENYPVHVPAPIEFRPGRRHCYPGEESLEVQGEVLMRGHDATAVLSARLVDLRNSATIREWDVPVQDGVFTTRTALEDLRINEDPITDYAVEFQAPNGASARMAFGRLEQPMFDPLPPIREVRVAEDGMLLVNGERFFPIVASLNVKDLRKGHADAAAMGCNVSKHNFGPPYADVREVFDYTWSHNNYEAPCLSGHPVEQAEQGLFPVAREHPAYLFTVAAEVYRQPTPLEHYRRCAAAGGRPVLYEYYNCGCWMDTAHGQEQGGDIAMFPIVVEKAPLNMMVSRYLGLERAAAHRPRTLFISIPIAISRGSRVEMIRCAVYLAIANRANGVYLYMTDYSDAEGEQIPMMRGIVLELRRLMPVLLAPPTPRTIAVRPEDSGIEVLERVAGGTRYLIAVNPERTAKEVQFSSGAFASGSTVRVRFEPPRELPIQDGAFRDTFDPCGVHVYEID